MIPEQKVTTHWSGKNISHYKSKNYNYTKIRDELVVDVKDLPPNATNRIEVVCDFCGKVFYPIFNNIVRKNGLEGPHHCSKCRYEYIKYRNLLKYGETSPTKTQEVKDKIAETNMKRRGVKCVFESEDIKQQIKETNMRKYGKECTFNVEEFKAKRFKTMQKKFMCNYPSQNEALKKRILDKRAETLSKNQSVFTSKQQIYLCSLFKGTINVPCSRYVIDFVVNNIAVEYDGGGHCLDLKLGKISLNEYLQKQCIRDRTIKSFGYKILRIVSRKDSLFEDKVLHKLFRFCKNYLIKTSHSWIEIDIDNLLIKCSERFICFSEILKESDIIAKRRLN